jgi:hypothetical protein
MKEGKASKLPRCFRNRSRDGWGSRERAGRVPSRRVGENAGPSPGSKDNIDALHPVQDILTKAIKGQEMPPAMFVSIMLKVRFSYVPLRRQDNGRSSATINAKIRRLFSARRYSPFPAIFWLASSTMRKDVPPTGDRQRRRTSTPTPDRFDLPYRAERKNPRKLAYLRKRLCNNPGMSRASRKPRSVWSIRGGGV